MKTIWTKHLKDEDKKDRLVKSLYSSKTSFKRLLEILQEEKSELTSNSPSDYNNSAWAYLQAHKNGQLSQIRKIEDLLSFIHESK